MQFSNKKINSAIKRKFIRPLNDGIEYNIKNIRIENGIKHKETISLLTQAYDTLNNVKYLLRNGYLVDSNSLLRSGFEYIFIGMMIQFEDNVFNEFIINCDDDVIIPEFGIKDIENY